MRKKDAACSLESWWSEYYSINDVSSLHVAMTWHNIYHIHITMYSPIPLLTLSCKILGKTWSTFACPSKGSNQRVLRKTWKRRSSLRISYLQYEGSVECDSRWDILEESPILFGSFFQAKGRKKGQGCSPAAPTSSALPKCSRNCSCRGKILEKGTQAEITFPQKGFEAKVSGQAGGQQEGIQQEGMRCVLGSCTHSCVRPMWAHVRLQVL